MVRAVRTRRLPPDERRAQIVAAVLNVIAEYGVPETTVSRIAKAAGVSEGTLYVYFESRTDMLLAALESIQSDMFELIDQSPDLDAPERLRAIGRAHSQMMKTERGGFTSAWIEFIAAGPQVGLRDAVARTQMNAFQSIRGMIEDGIARGTIAADVDPDRLAWGFYTVFWAENIACLMGLDEYMDDGHSAHVLGLILEEGIPAD